MYNLKKLISYLALIIAITIISSFQGKHNNGEYDKQWEKVESFAQKGQPQSALTIIDEIYKSAKNNGISQQVIKSLLYRLSLQSSYQEDHIINSISTLKNELSSASIPEKQILQSLIAQLYHTYYTTNRWKVNQRQQLLDAENNDINTWDAITLNREIELFYVASLENEKELEQIPLDEYEAILMQGDSSNFTLWPSLFDLLANRALSYFSSSDIKLSQIGNTSYINRSDYFSSTPDFVNLKISPYSSPQSKTLNLFQKLLTFHLDQNNTEALIDLDLKRLQYVYENSSQDKINKGNYIVALTRLSEKYNNHPVYVSITHKLAELYYISGNNYIPDFSESSKPDLILSDSICRIALDDFPDVHGSNNCRNLLEKINQVNFGFDISGAHMPNQPLLSLVSFQNINRLHFKIVAGDPKANANRNRRKEQLDKELKQKEIISWEQELPQTIDHRLHTVEIEIPELDEGYYIIFVSNDSLFRSSQTIKYKPIWITNLSYITNANKIGGYTDMLTINRETGKSIGNVDITIYKREYNNQSQTYNIKEISELTTDKYGYAKIEPISASNYGTFLFMFEKDGNQLFSENYLNFYKQKENKKPKVHTYLFTDRAVYRPGQTVYFKGIVTEELGDNVTLLTNYDTEIEFINASRKKISTPKFTTNNNGAFDGAFIIPLGGLNGQMTIKCKTGRVSFLVENYKLPTFEIVFDSVAGQPKLGENVTITGMATSYSGIAVDGATVRYRVIRKTVFPWPYYYRNKRWYPPNLNREIEIANGETLTSSDGTGTFEFQFEAIPDNDIPAKTDPVFYYEISIDVIDITGEVQSGNTSVRLGNKSVILTFEIPSAIELSAVNNQKIIATNLNGTAINFDATISLYKLTPPMRLLNKQRWSRPDFYIIPEDEFKQKFPHDIYKNEDDKNTWHKENIFKKQINIVGQTSFKKGFLDISMPGEYMIVAQGKDISGKQVETKHFFTVFSTTGRTMPGNMINWAVLNKNVAEPGETLKLVVGSAAKRSLLMYEIVNGHEIIERKWITVSRGQKIIDIPVTEAYRGNFSINISMVRFNRYYSKKLNVTVPFSNKKLDIKLSTFRNHLTPGTKEEWSVTISGNNGKKLAAELLAGMYDASLDVFRSSNWQMNLYHNKRQSSRWESNQFNTSFSSTLINQEPKYYKVKHIEYPSVNWFGYQFRGNNYFVQGTMDGGMRKSEVVNEVINPLEIDKEVAADKNGEVEPLESNEQKAIIPLRSNFNETAFFYPNLKTDSLGNVVFSFDTPDALTEWKVMMLAYTDDLKVGTLEKKIKSQKELMIIPNVPRFVRQGDTLVFTAKVINFTDNEIVAETNIEFFDAISMKTISLIIEENSQLNTIGSKQSTPVSWTISIPDNINMIGYKITASAGTYTDGEERIFPVLTNRMLVTNAMPMNVSALSTVNFTLDGLSQTENKSSSIKNYRYTIEFTSNPAWYAIQALPYLSEPKNKSNVALFNAYFANSLSSFIVNRNPGIKAVFESWKHLTPDAFLSNLEKNQSLKNTLLASSPWVLDAENETEQKRRISILFDINQLANQKETLLNRLHTAQLPSGAWPWFKGMRDDRNTTQTIVLGIAKLHHKGVLDLTGNNKRFSMIKRAISWLDNKIVDDYNELKKNNYKSMKNYHIRSSQTQYLYLRALLVDLVPIPEKSKEAFDYYIGQEKKYWLKQSNLLQGMIALTLNKFGHRNKSEAIIRSLKERSLYNKEMGMYWRMDAGWNWYQAPVETQAMMIETMVELDNNPTIIEQLKIWLLKQKQTQHWKTSSATAEAVFALLMYGNNDLENNNLVDITVGNQTVDVKGNPDIQAEAGTGYFSTSWSGDEITKEFANISVTNPNNNIAWGAAYWQYFEDMDKIESHDSPLSISKKLYVEKLTDEGIVLVAIEPNQILKTGDKVVARLIITTDRNMEYIHLEDMRATTFEPVAPTSGYTYEGGLWYYKNITNVSTDFFIRQLQKGTYVLEYPMFITQKGDFTNGIATIQSMYAPEFAAHSSGLRVKVGEE